MGLGWIRKKSPTTRARREADARDREGLFSNTEVARTDSEWSRMHASVLRDLPWFGQDILPATGVLKRRPGERITLEDQRRVLLSWLAGPPASQVAHRAGVSRRTVYSVVRRLFYTREPVQAMSRWDQMGLIACMVTPYSRYVSDSASKEVICLICHRIISPYPGLAGDLPVGTVFPPDLASHLHPMLREELAGRTQAHLLLHFYLGEDPVPFGRLWRKMNDRDAWSSVEGLASTFVFYGRGMREALEVPEGYGVVQDAEQWRRWRLRLLMPHKPGSVLPPLTEHKEGL